MAAEIIYTLKKKLPKSSFLKLRKIYNTLLERLHPRITEDEFRNLLTSELGIKSGSVVFIHSSVDKMFLGFSYLDILPMLREIVGSEGTLIFPCSHIKIRAEEYLENPEAVFDVKHSVTVRGILPEIARQEDDAFRSLHPTNSVVAIGKLARELTIHHHETIYPCGEKSPFFEITRYNGLIVGLGISVDRLSFVHSVEDVMKEEFPVRTRLDKKYECKVIDNNNNRLTVLTLVASRDIGHRNVKKFVRKYIKEDVCRLFRYKGVSFFSADSKKLFDIMTSLAREGKTIYSV
ncbi:MAG: AAC(3) family N-acetyltransferase [Bacteroidales bacterium]|jgi:aminoglycoside 3-N-acetyltransferase|nr:AAC(3) family N-acetyltransferase [Bacteroidales bacterium]